MKNLIKKMNEINSLYNDFQTLEDKCFQINHDGIQMESGSEEWVANLKQWNKTYEKKKAVEKNLVRKIKSLMNRMGYQLKTGISLGNYVYLVRDLDTQVKAIQKAMTTIPSWSDLQLKK